GPRGCAERRAGRRHPGAGLAGAPRGTSEPPRSPQRPLAVERCSGTIQGEIGYKGDRHIGPRKRRAKQGYRYHPDRQSADAPAEAVEECVRKFIEIDQAWKILGHEETKKEYDLLRLEDDLRNLGPVDAQVYLEEMSWNEDDHSFSLSCRCGGKYRVSKDEAEEVTLISCDTCSLIVELLHRS
uniref:DnaJ heat shock protein family (Hsp40) member C24 n=1 Tax=Equus asinus TaxID=9793 RepID=A0A9L0JH15_EQUAS